MQNKMPQIETTTVGFIGLGAMGEPMALNLVKAGIPLLVWNRTAAKRELLAKAGAETVKEPAEVFARRKTIILMLANATVIDTVLQRGTPAFSQWLKDRTLINMGTNMPAYSKALALDVLAAGGRYVEAPVSGSRKPAEAGQLVAMLAGEPADIASVRPILTPMCREIVECGPVPNALLMKLAVNIFLITTITGLAESIHFAERQGLDLNKLVSILNAGQMASDISRVKTAKLLNNDFSKQAGITDVLENNRLILAAAREAGLSSPLLDVCHALYTETQAMGLGDADMIAVIRAFEQQTLQQPNAIQTSPSN